jgi:hypothetical protein
LVPSTIQIVSELGCCSGGAHHVDADVICFPRPLWFCLIGIEKTRLNQTFSRRNDYEESNDENAGRFRAVIMLQLRRGAWPPLERRPLRLLAAPIPEEVVLSTLLLPGGRENL